MSEVLVRFTGRIPDNDGKAYLPQACTGPAEGLWEGWIEFVAEDGSAVRTPRETIQPNRDDVDYWAKGLTATYLEGALTRALDKPPAVLRAEERIPSNFPGPATGRPLTTGSAARPVLDPITTYSQGEELLRSQLLALSRDNLINIVKAYQLDVPAYESMPEAVLVGEMVAAVRRRVGE